MKHNVVTALALLCFVVGPVFSAGNAHDHDHEAHKATLQLNAGKKWETDAPLRKAIGEIRQSMADSLHAIHENKFSPKAYDELAKKVEGAVSEVVANCKLPPAADAQLHIIIADLLTGAEQMAGKTKSFKRMDGAAKIIGVLDSYGKYFDDPGFQSITH